MPGIYQVLNMVTIEITFSWKVTLFSLAYRNRLFGETCCLCLRDARVTLKSFCFKKQLVDRVGYINVTLQLLPIYFPVLNKGAAGSSQMLVFNCTTTERRMSRRYVMWLCTALILDFFNIECS
jgi:hypothetical protein